MGEERPSGFPLRDYLRALWRPWAKWFTGAAAVITLAVLVTVGLTSLLGLLVIGLLALFVAQAAAWRDERADLKAVTCERNLIVDDFARYKAQLVALGSAEREAQVEIAEMEPVLLGAEGVQFSLRVVNLGDDARFDAHVNSVVTGATPETYGHFSLLWEGTTETFKSIVGGRAADVHVARLYFESGQLRFMVPPASPQGAGPWQEGLPQTLRYGDALVFLLQIRDLDHKRNKSVLASIAYPERQFGALNPLLPALTIRSAEDLIADVE